MGKISLCAAALFGIASLAGCGGEAGGTDCGGGICGCSSAVTLAFEANVKNGQTMGPVEGIELYCVGEDEPIAVSDATGKVAFSIETSERPGCGPARCLNLRFHDPTGPLDDKTGTYYEHNGKDVVMQYKPD